MKRRSVLLGSAALVLALATVSLLLVHRARYGSAAGALSAKSQLQAFIANPRLKPDSEPFLEILQEVMVGRRKITVLYEGEKDFKPGEKEPVERVGHTIYYENQERLALLDQALAALVASSHSQRHAILEDLLTWIESGSELYDADRLAFRDSLLTLQHVLAADQALPSVKLHRRTGEDLAALDEIEAQYDKELKQIFGRFEERGIAISRQRWDDYLAKLKAITSREQILKDYGSIIPYARKADADETREISGKGLPPKTLMLTFDDGPHGIYTDEIAAILKQYGVPGLFFELGQNLGSIGPDGQVRPGRLAEASRRLLEAGNALGNHSFSHANFLHQDEASLRAEITQTDRLLKAIHGEGSHLFRFPFGARSEQSLSALESFQMRSMLWNIDSRDWADPVPNSIAQRVFQTIDAEQRGIVLFHDINARTVKALPGILDRLIADGYHFASWDGKDFKVGDATIPASKATPTTGYRESWAVVIGIDDYPKWPRLQYAARDADAIRQLLTEKFGFTEGHVLTLKNQEATRANILACFNTRLGGLQRDDRLFVFFAGHGATRKLSSGRDLGYIIPVDSDPQNFSSDAIPMTEVQDIAEAIAAKHVLFVMDSCYSGLGLTRGASSPNFLKENARRIGRQMLTAGGADQMVSDGGPGGHSIFTWTLLQGLGGKADLNGDGFITSTELAAFLSPAVASVSAQTPAFGSLPGSEGGEFVFEMPAQTEFLNQDTKQLEGSAIALSQKMEAKKETAPAAVIVKTLEGGQTKLAAGKPAAVTPRQAAQVANDRGLQLYREKRYQDAEAQFTEALKLKPDFALAANNLGFVYFKQDKFQEAIRWFENTLKMDPSRAIAYLNLAEASLKIGEKEKAHKALQTYLELWPKGPSAAWAAERLKES